MPIANDIKITDCDTSGVRKAAKIVGTLLGYSIVGAIIGLISSIVLIVLYIIPLINIPIAALFLLMDSVNIGFLEMAVGLSCIGVGIGCLLALKNILKKMLRFRLQSANFRRIDSESNNGSCHFCEHLSHYGEKEFYCEYLQIKFICAEDNLECYICDSCHDLIGDLVQCILLEKEYKSKH